MTIRDDILDLLVDGPSSVAAMYGSLVRACGHSRESVAPSELLRVAATLLDGGEVRAFRVQSDGSESPIRSDELLGLEPPYTDWLKRASLDELDVDEIGIWLALTSAGRAAWERLGPVNQRDWLLDYAQGTLVIRARTPAQAQAGLDWWLSTNQQMKVVGIATVRSIDSFEFKDGTRVAPAVELVATAMDVSSPIQR